MVAPAYRVRNVSVSRPIIYGNITTPLELKDRKKDTPPDHTHKWTIFVRDPAGKDDLSYFIRKVIFKLHDTYAQPMRTVEKPPFEVTETGWGEFEVTMRIFFVSAASEKNVVLYHHLKLHPYGANAETADKQKPPPVESILYDELVFSDPTEAFFDILTSRPGALLPARPNRPYLPFSYQTEAEEIEKVHKALETVVKQVETTHSKIKELEAEKNALTSGSTAASNGTNGTSTSTNGTSTSTATAS